MTPTDDYLHLSEFHASEGVADWRTLSEGVTAFFRTGSLAQSVAFATTIAGLPDVEDHPPAIDIRSDGVTVRLITVADDWYGPSRRDLVLAQRISQAAEAKGLTPEPSRLQSLLIVPGAPNTAEVMPFWHAALGYERRADSPEEDLVDPRDRGPSFWFEPMDEPRPDGGGAIHIAVWVPPEEAEARLAAALAAGGRLVRDRSPAWWTLADAAGNEVDIATTEGRD